MNPKPALVLLGVLLGSGLSSCSSTSGEEGTSSAFPSETSRPVPASGPRRDGDKPPFDVGNGVNSFLSLAASTTPAVPPLQVTFNYSGKCDTPPDTWSYVLQVKNTDSTNAMTFGGEAVAAGQERYLLISFTYDQTGNPLTVTAKLRKVLGTTGNDQPLNVVLVGGESSGFIVYAEEISTGGLNLCIFGPSGCATITVSQ